MQHPGVAFSGNQELLISILYYDIIVKLCQNMDSYSVRHRHSFENSKYKIAPHMNVQKSFLHPYQMLFTISYNTFTV